MRSCGLAPAPRPVRVSIPLTRVCARKRAKQGYGTSGGSREYFDDEVDLEQEWRAPPAEVDHISQPDLAPEDIYQVFKRDTPQASVRRLDKPDDVSWSPQTGFVKAVDVTGRSKPQPAPSSPAPASPAEPQDTSTTEPFPASRNLALRNCALVSVGMIAFALIIRPATFDGLGVEAASATAGWAAPDYSWSSWALVAGAALLVTGARSALLSSWPDFRQATDRSNKQVLSNLGPLDVILIATISGLGEEALFRGAVIPTTFPDWRGAALSAAVFGLLHVSGGRNLAYAAWATGVGCVYGALLLLTHTVWAPAAAHAFANWASATLWLQGRRRQGDEGR